MNSRTFLCALTPLLAALGLAGNASALTTGSMSTDTVNAMEVKWSWDGDGGFGFVSGSNWFASLDAVFDAGRWTFTSRYQHGFGPHGEDYERVVHDHSGNFAPGSGFVAGGLEDHDTAFAFDTHIDAHHWSVTANGPSWAPGDPQLGGFATQSVVHVPEPGTYALMFLGLGALWARRRA